MKERLDSWPNQHVKGHEERQSDPSTRQANYSNERHKLPEYQACVLAELDRLLTGRLLVKTTRPAQKPGVKVENVWIAVRNA